MTRDGSQPGTGARKLPVLSTVEQTMRGTFGLEAFREGQEQVIRLVLGGTDTLAIMPTGAGKSLCYQLPALHLPGMTIVVSPLISLMKDQVDKLNELGVRAVQVNSSLGVAEERRAVERIRNDEVEFVFTTPERMADAEFISLLKEHKLDLFVVDEAHCISEWGHDFRPSFLALGDALRSLGRPPLLALTATAPEAVVSDIRDRLGLPGLEVVNTGTYRPNLVYEVRHVPREADKREHLAQVLRDSPGAGIVYVATVRACNEVFEFLTEIGFKVARYHGKLSSRERHENQDRFMRGELEAVVATNAFGMGIDKPDIRFVVHYQVPGSIDSYYQESGRAGRDGNRARCLLLYRLEDRRTQMFFLGGRYPGHADVVAVYRALEEAADTNGTTTLTAAALEERARDVGRSKVRVVLALLKEAGTVRQVRGARYRVESRGLGEEALGELARRYEERAQSDRAKLERMLLYAQSALCRWKILLEYFGEEVSWDRCGTCDNCLSPPEVQASPQKAPSPIRRLRTPRAARVAIQPGMRVGLPQLGQGEVVSVEGDIVHVRFPAGDTRRFKRRFVQLVDGAQ